MSSIAWHTRPVRNADWFDEPDAFAWTDVQREVPHVRQLLIIDELVGRALASAIGARDVELHDELEQRFLLLAQKWEAETGSLSSVTKRVMHPNYQAIVGMGRDIVPILLRDLQLTGRDWFWALSAITQERPVRHEDAGRMDKMTSAWLAWGKGKGLI